ncbi:MAG: type III-B CRISPR-associated protein Cas10/Cmr2, partial [Bernardetiaceae bacterium]|nr:type III-B CRISPR-associated protein Cas10/Cmr2 [Bernardetiaceae bacterium]
MTHLFLFTIGPVQSFIAQARKTQDLYAGSRILSDLISKAIDILIDDKKVIRYISDNDNDLIFPARTIASKPNRFVAIITCAENEIQSIGDDLKAAVENHFVNEVAKQVIAFCPDSDKQLKDFLKIYWAALRVEVDAQNNVIGYPEKYKELEQLLGAVKNVRYFNQFAEKGRKCSINGEYNVKFYRKGEKEKSRPDKDILDKKLFHGNAKVLGFTDYREISQAQLQAGEGLCAVSFLKRVYEIADFPSTANIALLHTLNELESISEGASLLQAFALCFGKPTWQEVKNGQLFYDENLNEEYFKKQNIKNGGLACAKGKLKELNQLAKDTGLQLDKSKYYAILAFDADGMGGKLGKATTKEQHQKISELLGAFAQKAEVYINNNQYGRTVYAGGDDFLGFLNLNHLFEAMQALREMFDTEVNAELDKLGYTDLKLTFSAGVAIAHYKTPLSEVLTWARAMEKEAKKIDGILDYEKDTFKNQYPDFKPKNAFSIAVLKHSGEIHKTLWKWRYQTEIQTTDIAKALIKSLLEDNLSRKFINTLTWTFENLMDKEGKIGATVPKAMIQMELSRLITRQTKIGDMAVLGTDLFNL